MIDVKDILNEKTDIQLAIFRRCVKKIFTDPKNEKIIQEISSAKKSLLLKEDMPEIPEDIVVLEWTQQKNWANSEVGKLPKKINRDDFFYMQTDFIKGQKQSPYYCFPECSFMNKFFDFKTHEPRQRYKNFVKCCTLEDITK